MTCIGHDRLRSTSRRGNLWNENWFGNSDQPPTPCQVNSFKKRLVGSTAIYYCHSLSKILKVMKWPVFSFMGDTKTRILSQLAHQWSVDTSGRPHRERSTEAPPLRAVGAWRRRSLLVGGFDEAERNRSKPLRVYHRNIGATRLLVKGNW